MQADPSPTTSFLASLNNLGSRLVMGSGKNSENQAPQNDDNFLFRPHSIPAQSGCSPTTGVVRVLASLSYFEQFIICYDDDVFLKISIVLLIGVVRNFQ